MNGKNELITQSTILCMGWTKAMIKNLLPEPMEKPNPHYKCAAPMKLWQKDIVLEAMETDEYKIAFAKASKRKKSAKSAVKTKEQRLAEKMIEFANNTNLKTVSDNELVDIVLKEKEKRIKENIRKSMNYYERRVYRSNSIERDFFDEFDNWENDNDEYERLCDEYENYSFHRPNDETLNRWVVNYIRHNFFDYSLVLSGNKGKTGKDEAYPILKKAILNRIAAEYPKYAAECCRQAENIACSEESE